MPNQNHSHESCQTNNTKVIILISMSSDDELSSSNKLEQRFIDSRASIESVGKLNEHD